MSVLSLRFLLTCATLLAMFGCSSPQFRSRTCEPHCDDDPCAVDGGCGDAGPLPISCVGTLCSPAQASDALPACCDPFTGECGLKVQHGVFEGCYAQATPGSVSEHCGKVLDLHERANAAPDRPNGKLDTLAQGVPNALPGCCTQAGTCGVMGASLALPEHSLELGLGCVDLTRLADEPGEPSSPEPAAGAPLLPYCVSGKGKADAACPPRMFDAARDLDLCDEIASFATACDQGAATPDWLCALLALPSASTGKVPDVSSLSCMEFVPSYIQGCGVGVQAERCVPDMPSHLFGCEDTLAPVPGVPEYVCGCGLGVVMESCLSNTSPDVCGAEEITGPTVPGVPEYACGCGDGLRGTFCLPNVPQGVCGEYEVTEPVPGLPAYLCGCGDGKVASGCLPNVEESVCGAVPWQEGDALPWPEFLCGCGESATAPYERCIPHVPATRCGDVEIASGPIPGVRNAECGCGDEVPGDGSCLPNVPLELCGAIARCIEGEPGSGPGDTTRCAAGEVCKDLHGTGGTVGSPPGDDLGDTCEP